MVFEEDRNLILTVDPVTDYTEEHPIRTMTNILESKQYTPGTVVVNGNSWYAVVIDLDRKSICRTEWCKTALDRVFELVKTKRISSLALPILGTVHGGLLIEQELPCLLNTIAHLNQQTLKKIWIVMQREEMVNKQVRRFTLK